MAIIIMGKNNSRRNSNQQKVTIAHACRDVLLRAISTGQLIPLTIAIIFIIFITRIPADSLVALANRILDEMVNFTIFGYVLFVIALLVWSWHASIMRKCFSAEVERIGKEKTKYQQRNTKHLLGTSDK